MHILVTAASRHQATIEVAQAIANALERAGIEVDLCRPEEVGHLARYDAVVLGSAVYAGRWLKPATDLVEGTSSQLRTRPVWLFSTGPIGEPPKPGGLPADVAPMLERSGAREHRLFGGRLDRRALGLPEKAVVRVVGAPEGDFRPWDDIVDWAEQIASSLVGFRPARHGTATVSGTALVGVRDGHGPHRAGPGCGHLARVRRSSGLPLRHPADGLRTPLVIVGTAHARIHDRALPSRVLVATDATATSASAERAGIDLAVQAGASLIFLSVIDPSRLRLPGGLFHMRVDQVRDRHESSLARTVSNARQHGVSAQYLIWEGEPGASVIEAAASEGADVIVVGSHARGHLGRLLLGSVSSYIVEHASRPVVVIRPGQALHDVWPIARRIAP